MFGRKKIAMIVAECLGTAVLTMSILAVSKSAIGIPYFVAIGAGATLALLVLVLGSSSGAHVNPAVTFGLWTLRKISMAQAVVYFAAQFLGALVAWRLYTYMVDGPIRNIAGAEFDWRILIAELVGTLLFTFGIAAAVYQKYEGGKLAATIGISLTVGILTAAIVSNGLLNPAVAMGVNSWSKAYVIGPLVGSVIGMNLYALLFAGEKVTVPRRPIKRAATNKTVSSRSKKK